MYSDCFEVLAVLCSVLPLVVGGDTATIVQIWMRQFKIKSGIVDAYRGN